MDRVVDTSGNLVKLVFKVSDYRVSEMQKSMPIITESVFVLSQTSLKYHLIRVSPYQRQMFPGYKVPFILDTDVGRIITRVSSAPRGTLKGNPFAGQFISKNLKDWFVAHPELKAGDKVQIETIERERHYRLKLLSTQSTLKPISTPYLVDKSL